MNVKEIITVENIRYEVIEQLGAGGQGSVWKIKSKSDGKFYAIKILNEADVARRANKIANIRQFINEKLDEKLRDKDVKYGINHVFPVALYYNAATQETGYIMEFVSGKTLSKMLVDGTVAAMNFEDRLKLLKKVAVAVDALHNIGYCYTDISFGNFMYDAKSDVLYVIDCENVTCSAYIKNGQRDFLKGTGFFIAPEVAFGRARVSYESDKYALATLIFCFLTDNIIPSAYHGKAMYSAQPACQDMTEVAEMEADDDIDKNWRFFVFDETNRSNGLDDLCKHSKNPENIAFRKRVEKVIAIWGRMPPSLKALFRKAFDDPFKNNRPLPSMWVREIDNILSPAKAATTNAPTAQAVKKPTAQNSAPAPESGKIAAAPRLSDYEKAREKINKYGSFVPAGARKSPAAPQTAVPKPCLVSSVGKAVALTADETVVEGAPLGLAQKTVGTLKRTGSEYSFTSSLQTAVDVIGRDGSVKSQLCRGQTVMLESGESIKPVLSTVSIRIDY